MKRFLIKNSNSWNHYFKDTASNGNYNRTKHVNLKYHYVKDLVSERLVNLLYVNTNDNLADMFTKVIPKI